MNTPRLRCGIAAAITLAVASTLAANPYLSGSFGSSASATPEYRAGASLDIPAGPVGTVAIGYRMPGYRLEFEIGFGSADINHLVNSTVRTPATGSFERLSAMVNLYYDFDQYYGFSPYVGAGAGYARTGIKAFTAAGVPAVSDEGYSFAWQWMGGVSYEITRTLEVFAQFRQVRLRRVQLSDSFNAAFELNGVTMRSVEAGLRLNFD